MLATGILWLSMRRTLVVLLAVVTACSGQELAPTTSSSGTAPTTTQTTAATTVTTVASPTTATTETTTTTLAPLQGLEYREVARVEFPIQMVPWTPGFELVATKEGQVYVYDGEQLSQSPVLDISDQVQNEGERGLLSITVHPDDTNRVFVHYSANGGDTVVSEFAWENESLVDEQVIFTYDQPAGNHNGGMLQFGPDGLLYLGLGDGGGANDTFGNGQNTDTLLGTITRIDVDRDAGASLWQYGLRNPWRFWIDGDLIYIADVGQNAFEEVNVAGLTQGVNYGWPITEGLHCFQPSSGCDTIGLTLPVIEVGHGDAGTCSITGGVVYRGDAIPEVAGHYFYSDYCGGYLRSFRHDGGEALDAMDWTDDVGVAGSVASFGVDGSGEMYVLTTESVLQVAPDRG